MGRAPESLDCAVGSGHAAPMLAAVRNVPHDPDRTVLHRALRVGLVLPVLFAFGLHGLRSPQFALLGAFGSFAALAMADFMGPRRSRLAAYLGLALLGGVLIVFGTALSHTLWPAVAAMLAIGTALQFGAVLGGQFALGNNAAILTFVVSVMVPAGNDALADRLAGWFAACACAAVTTALLWPRHEKRDLYLRLADAVRALAAIARAAAAGTPPTLHGDDLEAANDRVREAYGALGFRPIGRAGQQRALLGLIDSLGEARRFAEAMPAGPQMSAADRALAGAVATTFDAVADVLAGAADGRPAVGPDLDALVAARHRHWEHLDAAARQALARNVPAAAVVADVEAVFPSRVLSFVALAMATDAVVLSGRAARVVGDAFGTEEPTVAEDAQQHVLRVLLPHLSPRAVWFRNCVRAGAALALSVLVAKVSGIEHAFWVVLATLTVLRSNVATTGATVISAVVGTFAGFLLASAATLAIGSHAPLLWAALPLAAFLACYAPSAFSLGTGQAFFALFVVLLLNLIAPEGWQTGAIRLEAVIVGALVALAASLIMWPRGASAAMRAEAARHVRAVRQLTRASLDFLFGSGDAAQVETALQASLLARPRAEEALGAYAGERGAKRVPLASWVRLVRVPVAIGVADDALAALRRAGYGVGGCPAAAQRITETAQAVCAALDEWADRLDDPGRAPDRTLHDLIADLDMFAGTGDRRAEIAAAIAACLDARRGDANVLEWMVGLIWTNLWLGYLAHMQMLAEQPLGEVAAHAAVPWWR
jgi:uncharacterized membrane protein YccC